jgi:RimJ/RimL family protein N-acetyltransferase
MPLIEILSYETIAALKLILLFTTLVLLLVALLRIKTALKNPLKDSLLALRPIRVFDFFTFFDWQNRKDLQIERRGFVGYVSPLKVLTWIEKRRRLENQEIPSRVITLMGIPIGYIGLYGFGSKFAVGIYLSNRWSRGFGIGKQALTKFLELCINRGFHDLYAIIARSNPASCHLFRTCGFEELNNFSVLESLEIKSSALGNDEVVFRVYNSKLTN